MKIKYKLFWIFELIIRGRKQKTKKKEESMVREIKMIGNKCMLIGHLIGHRYLHIVSKYSHNLNN